MSFLLYSLQVIFLQQQLVWEVKLWLLKLLNKIAKMKLKWNLLLARNLSWKTLWGKRQEEKDICFCLCWEKIRSIRARWRLDNVPQGGFLLSLIWYWVISWILSLLLELTFHWLIWLLMRISIVYILSSLERQMIMFLLWSVLLMPTMHTVNSN